MHCWFVNSGILGLLWAVPCAGATLEGRLVYVKHDAVYIAPARGGPAHRLPGLGLVWTASASPTTGAILYAVTPRRVPWDEAADTRGYVCRSPYRRAQALPPPLSQLSSPQLFWTGDGRKALVNADSLSAFYEPASNRVQRIRFEEGEVHSVSRDGRLIAYTTDREIRVRWTTTGRERVLFSIGRPEPLFAALRRSRPRGRVREFLHVAPALWRSGRHWRLGKAFLTPDGRTVYFATNFGSSVNQPDAVIKDSATEGTHSGIVAADVRTGRLTVLSRLGVFADQIPWEGEVSPDGRRLLFLQRLRAGADLAMGFAHVVDLRTQRRRELLRSGSRHQGQMNLIDGACWSPDGRYIAIATLYYDEREPRRPRRRDLRSDEFVLGIIDVDTGRTLRKIDGGRQPSWIQ